MNNEGRLKLFFTHHEHIRDIIIYLNSKFCLNNAMVQG